jgi:pilus assembly protein CpaE
MLVTTIRALVALDADVHEGGVRALLDEMPEIDLTAMVTGLDNCWTALADHRPDVLIVACQPDAEAALQFVREVTRHDPERPVVMLSAPSTNGFVRHAFEAGADDLVALPADDDGTSAAAGDLQFALEKVIARRSGAASSGGGALASLICVLGPKGGIGKTLTSANLAVALALQGQKVVVVDLDLQFGDVGLSLGLTPQRTVYDLVKSGGSLDADKIEAYLTPHASGLRVLMAPVRPDQAGAVSIEFLRELYPLLRASNDFVLVDTPPGFSPEVIASIDASTHVCIVGMLDSLSLKNTKLGLETLDLMGYERDRVRMVLNRADTQVGITREDVEAVVGRTPDVLVPSHREVARSVNEGVPIVSSRPRSEAARSFQRLASLYVGAPAHRTSRRLRLRRNG